MGRQNKIFLFGLFCSVFLLAGYAHGEGIPAEAALDKYTGSKACSACHAPVYQKWSKRLKANFVRFRKDEPGPLPGKWGSLPYENSDRTVSQDDVLLLVGKYRKTAFVDSSWTVIPFEYYIDTGEWNRRGGWAKNQFDYRRQCAPCHTVASNPYKLKFKELNVGCETCHGPGKNHAESPVKSSIRVPGKTDGKDVLHTCRKCHNDRGNHARALESFKGKFHQGE
jgi:hypothetical protein